MADAKTKITISFTERQRKWIDARAKHLQISFAEAVRRVLDNAEPTPDSQKTDRLYPAQR